MTIAHEREKAFRKEVAEDFLGPKVTPRTGKKFDTQAFLRNYRQLGLPNHRQARHRTLRAKVKAAQGERDFFFQMMQRAAMQVVQANNIIRELIDEKRFATRGQGDDTEILYVGDGEELEKGRKWLKQFDSPTPSSGKPEHLTQHGSEESKESSPQQPEMTPPVGVDNLQPVDPAP